MGLVVSSGEFLVQPSLGLLLWTFASLLAVVAAGIVTALKGRWGWMLAGLVLGGLLWLIAAWLPARRDSWWARRRDLGEPLDRRAATVPE